MIFERGLLCTDCWSKVNFISEPACAVCGIPFEFDVDLELRCAKCAQEKPFFDSALSLFRYDDASQNIIHQLKYNDKTYLAKYLAGWLHSRVGSKLQGYDYVIPVPMHRQRLKKRFYNQSALLAKYLSNLAGVEFSPNLLVKHKATSPQTGLSKAARFKNIRNSFSLNSAYKQQIVGANIILVDDVYTTGATLNECSRILKKASCAKIKVLTLARVY